MALYATDGTDYVFAGDAIPGAPYWCLECRAPVKMRRGRNRLPHFYHLRQSPGCHLYSKNEDHLLLQLQIQKFLAPEKIEIERPFFEIHRIADLVWEKESLVFEIQCSSLEQREAQQRVADYRRVGYETVWLLDDRIFNKRLVRPAEGFLRSFSCYFFSFDRTGPSRFYDQLEVVIDRKRLKKSHPLTISLAYPRGVPPLEWPSNLSTQVSKRIEQSTHYFPGDLLYRTLQAALS